jgi:hypothetical protein
MRKLLRSRIEKQIRKQQDEQRRELLRKRVEIAKEGANAYAKNRYIDALKKYQQYLLILEMWKKCGKDGLAPDHFDVKKDIYEMILICGIYWDMAKFFDRAKRADQRQELNLCLQKFVQFSKGFKYQPLSSEALRRYMGSGHCKHRDDFRKAYVTLTGERCFIATALIDVTEFETLDRLRTFREEKLIRTRLGRTLIRLYYSLSPTLAALLSLLPDRVRKITGRALNRLAKRL